MKESRNVSLDILRVCAMIGVIIIHTPNHVFIENNLVYNAYILFVCTCNPIFYMLSGYFNLNYKFETKDDYWKYYSNKCIAIIFPYVLISFSIFALEMLISQQDITVITYLKYTYKSLANPINHLWFMGPLIGLMLATPFLSKLVNCLKNWEFYFLFGVALVWNAISILFVENLNLVWGYSGWLFPEMTIYYFIGYFIRKCVINNKKTVYVLLGLAGYIFSWIGMSFFAENYKYQSGHTIFFVMFSMSVFILIYQNRKYKLNFFYKIISGIAKHSFTVYLVHWYVNFYITPQIININILWIDTCLSVLCTVVISLLIAFIIDKCFIYPIQFGLMKLSIYVWDYCKKSH